MAARKRDHLPAYPPTANCGSIHPETGTMTMPTSSMRHPHYESAIARDQRLAREEIARFLDAQARRKRAMAGARILPAIVNSLPGAAGMARPGASR